jgi:nitrate/nitrite transporter NarK
LGGLFYEKLGYNGVIGASFAVIAVDFVMRVLMVEKKVARRYGLDVAKANENEDSESTPNESDQQTSSMEDGELQPLLGHVEDDEEKFKLSADQPWIARIIPILPCLASPALLTALYLALVQAIFIGSFDATVTTVSRDLFGFDSLKAGLLFLPEGMMDLVFGPLAGWSIDRYGTKPAAVLSYAFMVPVLVLLRLPHAGGLDQIILYGGLLCLAGVGLAGQGAPCVVEAEEVVRKYHEKNPGFFGDSAPYAQLYALNSMMFNLGLTVGPELAGELKSVIGYGNMNIVLAVISAVTAVLSWMYIGGKPKVLRRQKE